MATILMQWSVHMTYVYTCIYIYIYIAIDNSFTLRLHSYSYLLPSYVAGLYSKDCVLVLETTYSELNYNYMRSYL